ncbi:MAG TPA: SAVED domain-containing protein [Longimicrobiaceae bacterium]|nr:SAVED domain-containing protein [Longimicrobiaceae bacterium]
MGEQSAARLAGDRYQHLYSWYELLRLLDEDYEYGYVEHPRAGAADDVTLHAPLGSGKASKFVQVKFHVTLGQLYSTESLVEVETGVRSLLHKLFDSWRALKDQGPVEIWLVSNWAAAPEFGRFIGQNRGLCDDFFVGGDRSAAGRARRRWREAVGVSPEEFAPFCRALRLRLGFGGLDEVEELVQDRMRAYGLRYGPRVLAEVVDEVASRIITGGEAKQVTSESLQEVISRRQLWASAPDEPKVSLWVHGWARRVWDRQPTLELDWTGHFNRDRRELPAPEVWTDSLLPALRSAREALSGTPGGAYIDFRGKLPLSGSLAVGQAFPEVAGFSFRTEQPMGGETFLWRSDAPATGRDFVVREERGESGDDLLIVLSITGEAWHDAETFFASVPGRFSAVVYAEPDSGPGPGSIQSAGDAVALAGRGKELMRDRRRRYGARRVHLVLYGPATFALFLGQRLNALGPVVSYERTAEGSYQAAIILQTG